jgi:hypothetical protein
MKTVTMNEGTTRVVPHEITRYLSLRFNTFPCEILPKEALEAVAISHLAGHEQMIRAAAVRSLPNRNCR